MLIKQDNDLKEYEVTDYGLYLRRRDFLKTLGGAALLGMALPTVVSAASSLPDGGGDEAPTDFADASSYNNFYEFGTSKESPAKLAGRLERAR